MFAGGHKQEKVGQGYQVSLSLYFANTDASKLLEAPAVDASRDRR